MILLIVLLSIVALLGGAAIGGAVESLVSQQPGSPRSGRRWLRTHPRPEPAAPPDPDVVDLDAYRARRMAS